MLSAFTRTGHSFALIQRLVFEGIRERFLAAGHRSLYEFLVSHGLYLQSETPVNAKASSPALNLVAFKRSPHGEQQLLALAMLSGMKRCNGHVNAFLDGVGGAERV